MGVQRRWAGGTGRAAILMLLVGLAACSKSATNAGTTPSPIPPTTVVTATATTTATASPSPRVSPSRSPSPRASVTGTVTATASTTPTPEVSATSSGTTSIKVGQSLSLRLSQGSDPADQWVFTSSPDASVLTVLSDQALSGGVHKWVFQGKAAGTTSFTVVQHGPGTPPPNISTFSQTVVVTP